MNERKAQYSKAIDRCENNALHPREQSDEMRAQNDRIAPKVSRFDLGIRDNLERCEEIHKANS